MSFRALLEVSLPLKRLQQSAYQPLSGPSSPSLSLSLHSFVISPSQAFSTSIYWTDHIRLAASLSLSLSLPMTPAYLNSSSPSLSGAELDDEDQHHQHSLISPNGQPSSSSSSSLSCHIYFHSSTTAYGQTGYYHSWGTQQHQYHQEVANNLGSQGEANEDVGNENDDSGLRLSLWKGEDKNGSQSDDISAKWMSSKMRLMQKIKINSHRDQNQITGVDMISPNTSTATSTTTHKFEDHKVYDPASSPMVDTDNSSSNNSNNVPVRVCADCSTSKTPLWRSGPRGPKSLCNACGIRQRKARRAMAAAANGTMVGGDQASPMKSKVEHKDRRSRNGPVGKYKKRSKTANPSDHNGNRLRFEDFLISLSKNLAFHRVFPQDEKEAAILLMALSCGFVHD